MSTFGRRVVKLQTIQTGQRVNQMTITTKIAFGKHKASITQDGTMLTVLILIWTISMLCVKWRNSHHSSFNLQSFIKSLFCCLFYNSINIRSWTFILFSILFIYKTADILEHNCLIRLRQLLLTLRKIFFFSSITIFFWR